MEEDTEITSRRRQRASERVQTEEPEQLTAAPDPALDPRVVNVRAATDALIAACEQLPDSEGRGHALAHARSVPIWAVQAVRGEG